MLARDAVAAQVLGPSRRGGQGSRGSSDLPKPLVSETLITSASCSKPDMWYRNAQVREFAPGLSWLSVVGPGTQFWPAAVLNIRSCQPLRLPISHSVPRRPESVLALAATGFCCFGNRPLPFAGQNCWRQSKCLFNYAAPAATFSFSSVSSSWFSGLRSSKLRMVVGIHTATHIHGQGMCGVKFTKPERSWART